ncbi:MAG: IucA/IucC family protein [Acidobacteriota bacterium]
MISTISATALRASSIDDALRCEQFIEVRRRILRQLIESLIYERVITPEVAASSADRVFLLAGKTEAGCPVTYRCHGRQAFGFDRIRLSSDPVMRINGETTREAESLAEFLLEIRALHDADETLLCRFIGELEQTLLKDTFAQYYRQESNCLLRTYNYDKIESGLPDGHPYHPSYKSRIGFDYVDNLLFGPEYSPMFQPFLLAAHRQWTRCEASRSIDLGRFIFTELGVNKYDECMRSLRQRDLNPDDYLILPVHPWQWREQIMSAFFEDIRNQRLVPLGITADSYIPQQSIRTLANYDEPAKAYLKHSLSIVNTSTSRILAPHTVQNAPLISDWLHTLVDQDPFLKDEMQVVILREVLGIAYDRPQPDLMQSKTYGLLSCIWRESIHPYLSTGESAVPWNILCHIDRDSRPFIIDWVKQHGLEQWLERLLTVGILPLIHLLQAHGMALESHAQNMVLIHRHGIPQRIALRDFHDGIRFSPQLLARPDLQPRLHSMSPYHARVNRNSFIITDIPAQVRDFLHDAFFFINLSELGLFLDEQFGFSEKQFWSIANKIVVTYQQRFTHLQDRFEIFDLYTPLIEVERLTSRRLFPDTSLQLHSVRNPLYLMKEEVCQ